MSKKRLGILKALLLGIGLGIIVSGLSGGLAYIYKSREIEDRLRSLEVKEAPEPQQCLSYTLKDYRSGEAPAKCQAEVYGDQF